MGSNESWLYHNKEQERRYADKMNRNANWFHFGLMGLFGLMVLSAKNKD